MMMQSRIYSGLGRTKFWLVLPIACIFSLLLTLPTINNNINTPNRIAYFNADEGGLMDVVWLYYSGEKRESFQWDFDYGLEMVYLADFARSILSRFIDFTPGIFVLILRWIHLLAWVFSFFALWCLVNRHFKSEWQAALCVALLATRPAFAYFSNNLKPEPLVLLIMIMGLNYTLRVIEEPSKKNNLIIAVICAVLAFLVKFAGLFLLPAIILSIYFAKRYDSAFAQNKAAFTQVKNPWIFPLLAGLVITALPLLAIFFYQRKSTGTTWYGQFGLWGSLQQNMFILFMCVVGLLIILSSPLTLFLEKSKNRLVKKVIRLTNELNSYALVVSVVFAVFVILFGFRWLITPGHFLNIYAQFSSTSLSEASSVIGTKGLISAFLWNFTARISVLDYLIFFFFLLYLFQEKHNFNNNLKDNWLRLYKRIALLIFTIPPLIIMFFMLRMAQHHMLPFFVAMSILSVQGCSMFIASLKKRRLLKAIAITLISILFIADIAINAVKVIRSRVYQFNQDEDIAFELDPWWRNNIPPEARIVSDHYIHVYIPSGYKNIRTLNCNEKDRVIRLRELVDTYYPEYVYYNARVSEGGILPLPEEIFPGRKLKLVKSFDSAGQAYQRRAGDKFVIYKIVR